MFAHYADNLKGLALIYEAFKETSLKKIEYIPPFLSQPIDTSDQWKYRVSYKYSDMRNFIKKSSRWNYEKEYRLFNEPNIIEAEKHNIKLRAIFYTLRFDETYLPILNKLNELHFRNKTDSSSPYSI